MDSIYKHQITSIDGKVIDLSVYKGKVLLIVNTASQCGYTNQYEGLEKVHERFREKGLVVMGFPSNDFGQQEPGANDEIKKFCQLKFGVTFPMFIKGPVKGPSKQPLFEHLVKHAPEQSEIKWNFEKFLVSRDGKVVKRFSSKVKPEDDELLSAVESLL